MAVGGGGDTDGDLGREPVGQEPDCPALFGSCTGAARRSRTRSGRPPSINRCRSRGRRTRRRRHGRSRRPPRAGSRATAPSSGRLTSCPRPRPSGTSRAPRTGWTTRHRHLRLRRSRTRRPSGRRRGGRRGRNRLPGGSGAATLAVGASRGWQRGRAAGAAWGPTTPAPPPPPGGVMGPPPDDWAAAIPTDVPAARRAATRRPPGRGDRRGRRRRGRVCPSGRGPGAVSPLPKRGGRAARRPRDPVPGPGQRCTTRRRPVGLGGGAASAGLAGPAGTAGAPAGRSGPAGPGPWPRVKRPGDGGHRRDRAGTTQVANGDPGTRTASRGKARRRWLGTGCGETRVADRHGQGRRNRQGGERQARAWPRVVAVISWIVLVMVLCWYYVFPWLERVLPENF